MLTANPIHTAFALTLAFLSLGIQSIGGTLTLGIGISLIFVAASVYFYQQNVVKLGAYKALLHVWSWLTLFVVGIPNLMMAILLIGDERLPDILVMLVGLPIFFFGSPYYAIPASLANDDLFLWDTVISPTGLPGLFISVVFYLIAATVVAIVVHVAAIISLKLSALAVERKWRRIRGK